MAQITSITSESLQAQIRRLLPSQQGFGEDLQASNVITPIIDLTSAAEGASTPQNLQTAWDFTTGIATISSGAATTLISNTGFWKVDLNFVGFPSNSPGTAEIFIDDGATTKDIWRITYGGAGAVTAAFTQNENFVVFLRAGDTLKASNTYAQQKLDVWYRQIADVNGNLVNPLGFTPQ